MAGTYVLDTAGFWDAERVLASGLVYDEIGRGPQDSNNQEKPMKVAIHRSRPADRPPRAGHRGFRRRRISRRSARYRLPCASDRRASWLRLGHRLAPRGRRKDVDAVLVCTPPHLHSEISIAAMENGKHVLCEKPLCRTMSEADAMLDVSQADGSRPEMWVQSSSSSSHFGSPYAASSAERLAASFRRVAAYGICGRPATSTNGAPTLSAQQADNSWNRELTASICSAGSWANWSK